MSYDEEDGEDGPPAIDRYTLTTQPDGTITGTWWTNDDEDRGYPNTEASNAVRFKTLDDLKLRTGLSHIGVSGVNVEVILDGVRV